MVELYRKLYLKEKLLKKFLSIQKSIRDRVWILVREQFDLDPYYD